MIALTLTEIVQATGGELHDVPDPQLLVSGGSSDSRTVVPGGLFAAIAGARVDGHEYAAEAVAAGAAVVLAQQPVGVPAVVVPDTVTALGQLAQYALGRTGAQVIALTGSSGKTTTKDLLAQVLATHEPTVATPGSFNTEVGLPLSVLGMAESTRFLVLEMGARHRGDLLYLTSLTPPKIGIVLNVGTAHIGEFGGRDAIAEAKAELVQALPPSENGGVAILNADDPLVAAMTGKTPAQVVLFGTDTTADIRATDITVETGRASFQLNTPAGSAPVALQLFGAHQVHNALAAAAAAHSLGMKTTEIAQALSAAAPVSAGRLEVLEREDGVTIVNDAFNANPDSMRASLHTLASIASGRRMIAVLGEMRELGDLAVQAHRDVGASVAEHEVDVLIAVGDNEAMAAMMEAAQATSAMVRCEAVADAADLTELLDRIVLSGDVVLIKASRSVGLEKFGNYMWSRASVAA
jgi:UDP-N-acetylmuramoyl-tripeptide--D-alanyl-D-alanine ligase